MVEAHSHSKIDMIKAIRTLDHQTYNWGYHEGVLAATGTSNSEVSDLKNLVATMKGQIAAYRDIIETFIQVDEDHRKFLKNLVDKEEED